MSDQSIQFKLWPPNLWVQAHKRNKLGLSFARIIPSHFLKLRFSKLNVTVLVNNAGVGELKTGREQGYHRHPLNELCLMSNLNAVVPSIMLKMILPRMERNKLGYVIMLGSAAAMAPFATLPLYGATKSFVHHLTKALRVSLKK